MSPSSSTDSPPSPQTGRRNRAVKLTLTGAAGAKVFAMACTFAQVPIALRYLGSEAYGLWIVLMSAYGILNFVDFGLGVGMQECLTSAFARDDREGLRRAFRSGVQALLLVGGGVAAVALPLAWWGDWSDWLGIQDPALRGQTSSALTLIVLAFLLGLPGNAISHLATAVQQHWRYSLWNAGVNGLTLAAVWLAAREGWAFLPFVAVAALLPALQNAGMAWQLRRLLGWAKSRVPGGLPPGERRRMWHSSALFAFPQLSMAVLGWLPAFTISASAGATAVTAFNLLQRLFSPFVHGHAVVLAPIWPVYAEARLRGDAAWLDGAQRKALRATLLAALGLSALALVREPLLHLWLGRAALTPATALTWTAVAWFTLQIFQRHYQFVLLGRGRLPALALNSAVGFAGALAGLLVGGLIGGAAWSLALGSVGFAVFGLLGLAFSSRPAPPDRARKES